VQQQWIGTEMLEERTRREEEPERRKTEREK